MFTRPKEHSLFGRFTLPALAMLGLAGCSAIEGYPADPEDTQATLVSLKTYFDPKWETQYNAESDAMKRQNIRDTVVLSRVRAYDLEFDEFERSLYKGGTALPTTADLVVLVLSGLGATIGAAPTKAALSAASAGVIGAGGVVNKDLFYQKTLPALLSQMEANRTNVKKTIFTGLAQPDAKYGLLMADIDLDTLKSAGSVPSAISNITTQAGKAQQDAQALIDGVRSQKWSTSPTTQQIVKWLYPNGSELDTQGNPTTPIAANLSALTGWMAADQTDPRLPSVPWLQLVRGVDFESDRQRAITALHIPQ